MSDAENTLTPPASLAAIPTKTPREEHPIASALEQFLHHAQDIQEAGTRYVSDARARHGKGLSAMSQDFLDAIKSAGSRDIVSMPGLLKRLERHSREARRLIGSDEAAIIEKCLFVGLFSEFDAFTGSLLGAIYNRRPKLTARFEGTVSISEILAAESLDTLRASIVSDEVESFRRKSYVEQFEHLERRFGLPLRKFERWPDFVECAQRRNLLTHANGIVSEQYLAICKDNGANISALKIGDRLGLGTEYFSRACELLMEVALKLGHTLWRKIFPDELERADQDLNDRIYQCLPDERWARAQVFGDFALGQIKWATDRQYRTCVVNVAIALKWGGNAEGSQHLMGKIDWSASLNEFKLANAVLDDRFDDAAKVMRRIGREGELIIEAFYHIWPLFRDFRESPQFLAAYEVVYGRSYVVAELERAEVTEVSALNVMAAEATTTADVAAGLAVATAASDQATQKSQTRRKQKRVRKASRSSGSR